MPLLGGLFSKRHPPSSSRASSNALAESVASSPSNRDSTEGDYVLSDRSPPAPQAMYNLPSASSSSKLRLPFRRKAPASRVDPKHPLVSLNDVPSHPYISSVTSDPGHDLSPPPRKSSLFSASHHESLPSLHSLPNESSLSHAHLDTPRPPYSDVHGDSHSQPAGQAPKKSLGLFSWARERTKSKPSPPSSTLPSMSPTSPSADDDDSFNLKSFRHLRADPSTPLPEIPSQAPSHSLLVPPRPRPRGDSAASDSSQRISIAAFREAQARSRANSPVPSFRPPSTADTLRVDANGRNRASTLSVVSVVEHSQPDKIVAAPVPRSRPDSAADTSSEDSESDDDDDEEVDSDGEPIPRKLDRQRTITRRTEEPRTRSDTGHSTVLTSMDQRSLGRQDPSRPPRSAQPHIYQSDQSPFTRPRASFSTSALTPNRAARRASIKANASTSQVPLILPTRKLKHDSDEETGSSDADSEDMPLSDLIAPRRPGSSASNQSGGRPRMPAKPLIDIKSLAGNQPLLTPILRHEDSVKNLSARRTEQDTEKDEPFSVPAALAHSSTTPSPTSPSVGVNATSVNKPASAAHHRRSSSDVPAPKDPENDDLMNAIRLVGALDKELDQSSETPMPSVQSPSDRIVPTPIRAREPPTSFTVLSRPAQRRSAIETSASLSPTWRNPPKPTSPALSPQTETGTRPRAPTPSTIQSDRSDALSVASAARSSRSSSRIPPVPLIHSIPDSPSVREESKSGRPRSSSHISAANLPDTRTQPISTKPSSTPGKMPPHAAQPSLAPRRPFASNSSLRGESPAGSSTGDSSSGRAPFTPRDGSLSDLGLRSKEDASDLGSTLKARGHVKKPSVTFEDQQPVRGRERAKSELTDEQKTRERRRSEAKAAIELGKIVNGRGPLVHNDSDEDLRIRGRNPTINVTMDNAPHTMMQPWPSWQQPMGTGGMAPMLQPQFSNDPAYFAAHQRALLIAKQTYQMAVAQHAMQVAGEEWERGSSIGFGGGGSMYGGTGGSVYGGGSGGSVYGGGGGGSVYGGMAGGPVGMMSMPNMGMLMPPPNPWGRSSVAFPSTGASAFGGISSSQSEYGGASGWGTRSVFGDSFGNSSTRTGGVPNSSASAYGGNSRPRAWTGVTPPSTSASSQPTRTPGKTPATRNRAAPPSSWKSGR